MIQESTAQTIATLKGGKSYPGLLRFLVGRVFYTDAINTVISYMSLYTVNVAIGTGLSQAGGEQQAQFVMLSAITFAVIGGFAWGWLVDRIGPKRTLDLVLYLWILTFSVAAAIGFLRLSTTWLYRRGSARRNCARRSLGRRPALHAEADAPDRVGEFYGLYGMVGRFSAVTGPLLWSAITYVAVERGGMHELTGQAIAIVTLLLMVLLSLRHSAKGHRRSSGTGRR